MCRPRGRETRHHDRVAGNAILGVRTHGSRATERRMLVGLEFNCYRARVEAAARGCFHRCQMGDRNSAEHGSANFRRYRQRGEGCC